MRLESSYSFSQTVFLWDFPGGQELICQCTGQIQSLVSEDPTCHRTTKPMCHKDWGCTLEPGSHNYWSPPTVEPVFCNKRGHHHEKPKHRKQRVIVKVAQSSPTLWESSVHGILQARILEGLVVPFSRGSSRPRDQTQFSHIADRFFTIWATREAQENWSG